MIDKFGKPGQTRFINPVTQDYMFDSNGHIVGGNGIQQLVYLALVTIRGSSAMIDLGQSFSNVKVIGANYVSLVKNEVNKALKPLIDQKKIVLIDVKVNRSGTNMSVIDVKWKDLATGTERTSTI